MLGKGKIAALGFQHVLAMYAGAVIVPLLIGAALGFNGEEMTYLVSIDIFMCGIATLLQLTVNRFFWNWFTSCIRLCSSSDCANYFNWSGYGNWRDLWLYNCFWTFCIIDRSIFL